jgi:hypothetical protein
MTNATPLITPADRIFVAGHRGLAGLQAAPRDEQLDFITLALGMTRT